MEEKDKQPTKTKLAVLIQEFQDFKQENKKDHEQIIAQTTKTNGRVTKLEQWRFMLAGGLIVVSILIVPIVLEITKNFLKR